MKDEEILNHLLLRQVKKRDKANELGSDLQKDLFLDVKFQKKVSKADREWAEKELELIKKHGASIVPITSDEYPESLKHIHSPPFCLYVLGKLPRHNIPHIAVVGTRKASHYGLKMSQDLSRELSRSGVVIVSGLARGCDTYAHIGALEGGGLTVAVLGTGLDTVYPRENDKLFNKIAKQGAVITEFPFGTPPLPHNFPARNRIISGLSQAVIVAEAPLKSGAMMTARMALDEGREVFAVPGKTTSDKSSGTNQLIKDGAMLVDSAEDILKAFSIEVKKESKADQRVKLNGNEEKIIEAVSDEPVHIDSLLNKTGLAIKDLSYILLDLELRGLIKQLSGNLYIKT